MFSKKKMNEFTGDSSDKTVLDLLTAESVLKSILRISERNTVFPTCIPAAFTITIHWKNIGLTGADIFT